jgi:hypothetical protein
MSKNCQENCVVKETSCNFEEREDKCVKCVKNTHYDYYHVKHVKPENHVTKQHHYIKKVYEPVCTVNELEPVKKCKFVNKSNNCESQHETSEHCFSKCKVKCHKSVMNEEIPELSEHVCKKQKKSHCHKKKSHCHKKKSHCHQKKSQCEPCDDVPKNKAVSWLLFN